MKIKRVPKGLGSKIKRRRIKIDRGFTRIAKIKKGNKNA